MCFINSICQGWQQHFGDTFASGLGLAAALLAVVLVLYIVLRLLWWTLFRHRKVSQIVMRGKTGDIVIACGMSRFENDECVASVFDRADQSMYENKKMLKASR